MARLYGLPFNQPMQPQGNPVLMAAALESLFPGRFNPPAGPGGDQSAWNVAMAMTHGGLGPGAAFGQLGQEQRNQLAREKLATEAEIARNRLAAEAAQRAMQRMFLGGEAAKDRQLKQAQIDAANQRAADALQQGLWKFLTGEKGKDRRTDKWVSMREAAADQNLAGKMFGFQAKAQREAEKAQTKRLTETRKLIDAWEKQAAFRLLGGGGAGADILPKVNLLLGKNKDIRLKYRLLNRLAETALGPGGYPAAMEMLNEALAQRGLQ